MQQPHSQRICTFMLSYGGFFRQQRQLESIVFDGTKINADIINDFAAHDKKISCGLPCINDTSNVCMIHKCKVPTCYDPVKNKDFYCFHDRDQSEYCVNHTCHSGDICWNLCINSSFCPEHKCVICDSELVRGTKFCKDHLTEIKCYRDGCTNYIQLTEPHPERISYVQYCSEHVCVNCKIHEKIDGINICHNCKCKCKGCTCVKTDKMCYCIEHAKMMCFYGKYNKCDQLQYQDSKYCIHHKCKFPECKKHIYEYSDEDGGYHSDYCYHHDSLNKICKKYFFDLDDKELRCMIESDTEMPLASAASKVTKPDNVGFFASERVQHEILPYLSRTLNKDELMEHIKFNMATIAIQICET